MHGVEKSQAAEKNVWLLPPGDPPSSGKTERLPELPGFSEQKDRWERDGILAAIRLLLKEPNTLFEDMVKKWKSIPI